jgi:hypothetical protein
LAKPITSQDTANYNSNSTSSVKLCACGCGEPAPIAKRNCPRRGHKIGQPLTWVSGHHAKCQVFPVRPLADRFWPRVKKSDHCWEWTGYRDRNGYGHLRVNQKMTLAHRCSYEMAYGPIPDNQLVRHKCDNPSCVRPGHLELGTHDDNAWDSVVRGRRCPQSHLTANDARQIRYIRKTSGMSYTKIARQFNVTAMTVYHIVKRQTWRHID